MLQYMLEIQSKISRNLNIKNIRYFRLGPINGEFATDQNSIFQAPKSQSKQRIEQSALTGKFAARLAEERFARSKLGSKFRGQIGICLPWGWNMSVKRGATKWRAICPHDELRDVGWWTRKRCHNFLTYDRVDRNCPPNFELLGETAPLTK